MENGLRSKGKDHFDDNFDTKEDNFISPSEFFNPRDSKLKRSLHKIALNSATTTPKHQITLESKWLKIIELYTMRDELAKKFHFPSTSQLKKKYPILPSGEFYKIMIKDRLFERDWKVNFPETIYLDAEGHVAMVYTEP